MEQKEKYDVFISYSRADYLDESNNIIIGSPVDVIVKALDDKNVKYWIDIAGDNTSNQYMSKISNAINNSKRVLFVSSKTSNNQDSYWPIQEISLAAEKHKEIVPIIIEECKYHQRIELALAGLNALEYYKNNEQAIEKLLACINGKKDDEIIDKDKHDKVIPDDDIKKWKFILGLILKGLVACFLFFSVFGTIGFCVGYFSNVKDEKAILDDAFRNQRIKVVNNHILEYTGDKMCFKYDTDTGLIDFDKNEFKLFDEIEFSHIMMSASIPLAFKRMGKASRVFNGKSKVVFLVASSIGILCGYSIGESIGLTCALNKNEDALKEYLSKDSTRKMMKRKVEERNAKPVARF